MAVGSSVTKGNLNTILVLWTEDSSPHLERLPSSRVFWDDDLLKSNTKKFRGIFGDRFYVLDKMKSLNCYQNMR